MSLGNTDQSYGLISRILHWVTALLIFVAFPLGFIANRTDLTDQAAIERVFALFSLHKTVGMAALAIGLARIAWSLSQPRPAPISGARIETVLARLTHWTLSIGLVLVPVSGWLAHSAAPGLAPILWPLGQYLPFVPTTSDAAALTGATHWLATKLLAATILLHVAGALKHAFIDRDGTLARMTTGSPAATKPHPKSLLAFPAALALWAVTIGLAVIFAPKPPAPPEPWIAVETHLELRSTITGDSLGQIPAADIALTLGGDDTGTLDIFAALDSLASPEAEPLLAALPIPIAQFSAAVSGTAPDLMATGQLDLGGQVREMGISINRDGDTATFASALVLPSAPDFALYVEATFTRPAE